jgi:excisionase family DNA binding protein
MTRAQLGALEMAVVEVVERAVEEAIERDGPRAFSVVEVADRLGVSEQHVRNLIARGQLRRVPHLDPIRIAAAELVRFLGADQ